MAIRFRSTVLHAALFAACWCGGSTLALALAQDASGSPTGGDATTLPAVTVVERADPVPGVADWGDVPLSKLPLQIDVYDQVTLVDYGISRLSELSKLAPAVSDAYNAVGYWDSLTLRGFVIDNRYNYRRDGLPINAETRIPLDNKSGVEVLYGISGMQAGTSSPGGLVNLVVKRPLAEPFHAAFLQWTSDESLLAAVDLSQRFGDGGAFGLRVNAAAEALRPDVNDADGHRGLIALSGDWKMTRDRLLQIEFESSRQSQPSVPGFSLLGDTLPAPANPRINLNNQPWSQPVVFGANTGSIRYAQTIDATWSWTAQAATQRLTTDDRAAFPFGCSAENRYDRYCSDGSFDLYDYRSENERRRTDAGEVTVVARFATGDAAHTLSGGVLGTKFQATFQPLAYNWVGTGNVDGSVVVPPDPTPIAGSNTNRTERSTELYLRDAIAFGDRVGLWLGLRHTRLSRQSVATDGSAPTSYQQSFNAPWLAATWQLDWAQMLYASWGRGVQSDVVPNLPQYAAPGQALPAILSTQTEVGWKGRADGLTWSVALFDITIPVYADVAVTDGCSDPTLGCLQRREDGTERHTGVELGASWRQGPWSLGGGLQWLKARRQSSQDPTVDGQRPVNVPAFTFKMQADYVVPEVQGLSVGANLAAEGDRTMLPTDPNYRIPSYTTVGLQAQWIVRDGGIIWTWRAGIDNLFDEQAWRESPYQFGHVYLFPLAGRTGRLSVQANW